jgi:hypothetical protein
VGNLCKLCKCRFVGVFFNITGEKLSQRVRVIELIGSFSNVQNKSLSTTSLSVCIVEE